MKSFLLAFTMIIASVWTPSAHANGPWLREFQNIKLPSQKVLDHYSWLVPSVGGATYIGSSVAISSTAATTISTFSAQPDVARNIVLTPTGTTANVGAGTAVVNGLNIFGKAISENFTITSTQSTATTGANAFRSITSIVFPQASGSGVTLSIGTGVLLGIPYCLDHAGDYVFSEFGGVYETTRGTQAVSGLNATTVEQNTFSPHGTMNGATRVDWFGIQNYECFGN